jgi:hypothetical protein
LRVKRPFLCSGRLKFHRISFRFDMLQSTSGIRFRYSSETMSESDESALTFYNSGIVIWKGLVDKKLDFLYPSLLRRLKISVSV